MIFSLGKASVRRTRRCCADLGAEGLMSALLDDRDVVTAPDEEKPKSVRKVVPGVVADVKASKVNDLFSSNSIRRRGDL